MPQRDAIRDLLVSGHCADPKLHREVTDAQWSDYGRLISERLSNTSELINVLNRGSMKAKTTIEFVAFIRAYLLTGSRP